MPGPPARRGGSPGDLIVTVHMAPHRVFRRRGNHLDLTVPVTLAEAALGAKIDIPTPRGTIGFGTEQRRCAVERSATIRDISVLVVDEERAFAESLALAIEFQAGFRSAGCALTFPAATQRLREATVDVALVTLSANLT